MKPGPVPLILQSEIAECGLACVAMISGAFGHRTDLARLRQRLDPGTRGASMKDIAALGEALGFAVRSLKLGPKQLDRLHLPAVLHWNVVHYVVLVESRGGEHVIHDPALGRRTVDDRELSRSFTGLAQEFVPREPIARTDNRLRVPWRWLIGRTEPYGRLIGSIFLMSLVMQAFVFVVPFGAQLLLDRVAVSRDTLTVALGFAISCIGLGLYALLLWMRSTVVIHLNNSLDMAGTQKLVAKMLSLPYDFFARRDIGSLMGRFTNLREIRQLLTQGLAESLVEALLALLALAAVFVYLPVAGLVALVALAAYAGYRMMTRPRMQEHVSALFHTMAAQSGSLIESLQKIETIKANALEPMREQFWAARFGDYQNSLVQKIRQDQRHAIAQILLMGVAYALSVLLAVRSLFDGQLTMGEALTLLLILGILMARAERFLDRLFDLHVARVHLDGLSDVVHAESEYIADAAQPSSGRVAAVIELRDVGFRYSTHEPFVFRHVSARFEAGRCVAITGPSGCGKSTLLSLLLGLHSATEGEIIVDGVPLSALDRRAWRHQVGSVLQSDRSFYGSVAENVTLFEIAPPGERVRDALRACALAEVVDRLPMKEHTMLSDAPMLSGGETQRLLLARALYKRPRLLLLDEASSHLDDATEARINSSLHAHGATRILVAHRRQTIELADTIIRLGHSEALGCSTVLEATPACEMQPCEPKTSADATANVEVAP